MCSPVCESPSKSGSYLDIWFYRKLVCLFVWFLIKNSNTVLCSHLSISEKDEELCNERTLVDIQTWGSHNTIRQF